MENIQQRLKILQQELQTGLVGRTQAVKIALLALLAEENVLLVGPPGTAKSLLARKIAQSIQSSEKKDTAPYFEYLLTKFSTPEEIFGPLSISELKKDCFKRNTLGYLPSAQVGFLDEIFKASSSILNSLLTIMNEKLYHNGTAVVPTPLRSLIAASNELPSGQEELEALYDRFLLRQYVGYVADNDITQLINVIASSENGTVKPLSPYELAKIKELSAHVKLSERIMQVLKEIWLKHREAFKEDRRESLSDRRLVKVVNLLKVSAATNGRSDVDFSDVLLLINCLWCNPCNIDKVGRILNGVIYAYYNGAEFDSHTVSNVNAITINSVAYKNEMRGGNAIKGYLGLGTKDDPVIISELKHLIGIKKAEIGQQGYYFKQVNDIDASELTVWPNIVFKGSYDGGGFHIKGGSVEPLKVFSTVLDNSSIDSLSVYGMSIAGDVSNSEIKNCESTVSIVFGIANNVNIYWCKSVYIVRPVTWMYSEHHDVHIKSCYATARIISGHIYSSVIENCFAYAHVDIHEEVPGVGLFESAERGSVIKNCLVKFNGKFNRKFSGINKCSMFFSVNNSTVENNVIVGVVLNGNNAVAKVSVSLFDCNFDYIKGCNSKIGGNVIYDGFYNVGGELFGCEVMSRKVLDQFHFESILGWDFDNVWRWDKKKHEPELRYVGIKNMNKGGQPKTEVRDILSKQCKANIWL
ncbi:AAA family ATPase [Plesiomonas shigelloides]|uniref:AAA family ATPase n=1 Tax=Plesiomonas shigelloides TaxID=703 RepID=UPI003139CFD2